MEKLRLDIARGSVVKCKAGKEKGNFYAVVSLEDEFVYLANGNDRLLDRPKKKKAIHIAPTLAALPESSLRSNRELRIALKSFNTAAVDNVD